MAIFNRLKRFSSFNTVLMFHIQLSNVCISMIFLPLLCCAAITVRDKTTPLYSLPPSFLKMAIQFLLNAKMPCINPVPSCYGPFECFCKKKKGSLSYSLAIWGKRKT